MDPTTISFVRHGNVYNPQDVYYGRLPRFGLSSDGLRQSLWVSNFLAESNLAAVFSSPMLRARQTARVILTRHTDLSLQVSPLLHEIHSPFDGQPLAHIASRDWDVYTGLPSEYERPQDIFVRTRKFVLDVRQRYAGRQVAAVSHGDVIVFTLLGLLGLPVSAQQSRMDFKTLGFSDHYPARASMVTLTFLTDAQDEVPQIAYVNPQS